METSVVSFAREVKEEITHFSRDDENKRALLSSFVKINGHFHLGNGKKGSLELSSEAAPIAKLLYEYIHSLYGVNVRFAYSRSAGFLKRVEYHVIIEEEALDICNDLGVDILGENDKLSASLPEEQEASYLAGAFLASGSVNDPKSTSYHLEISFSDESYAKYFLKVWSKVAHSHFSPKLAKRRKKWIVYLKKSEEIADFLILVGAKESCLKFEDVRVNRDYANVTNRLANLDEANMRKTLSSGEKQLKQINYFKAHGGIASFHNEKLSILCELREKHPEASLEELASSLSEELASSVSKSNVNHLFRFLDEEYKRSTHERKP